MTSGTDNNTPVAAGGSARETRWSAALFALWALWLSLPYFARGPLSYLKIAANADSHLSFLYWLKYHAATGYAALLHPVMCGTDRIADYGIPGLFDGVAWILPVPIMYALMMGLQRWIGSWVTYRLLRRVFDAPVAAAALAGLTFSLGLARGEKPGSEWMFLHFLQEPGFPILLYFAARVPLDRWRAGWRAALGTGLLMATAMNIEIGLVFTIPCAFLFGLIARVDLRPWPRLVRYVAWWFVAGACVLLYQFPHLWAAMLNAPDSSRSIMQPELRTYAWAWGRLVKRLTAMLPVALLAGAWLARFRPRARTDWALLVLLLITFFFGPFSRPLGQLLWPYCPFLSGFFFDRLFLYGPFCLVCAAALGLARLPWPAWRIALTRGERRWETGALILPTLVLAALVGDLSLNVLRINWARSLFAERGAENWHRLYANPDLRALADLTRTQAVRTVTCGAAHLPETWQPAFNIAYGLETADGFKNIYPWRYHQFWRQVVDGAYQASDDNMTRGFMDVSGYRMFLFPREAWEPESPAPRYSLPLLSLANVGYFISQAPLKDPALRLLPAAYPRERFEQWARRPVWGKIRGLFAGDYLGERLYVYANPEVFPRFFSVPRLRVFPHAPALLEALRTARRDELASAVFCTTADVPAGVDAAADGGTGTVRVAACGLEGAELDVDYAAPGFLVFSGTYARFWVCRLDGQAIPVFPAYHALMAVSVPAGRHTVRWSYEPPYAGWVRALFPGRRGG